VLPCKPSEVSNQTYPYHPFLTFRSLGERGPFRDLGDRGHSHVRVAELKIAHSPMRILCGE
jgi:hypothetical protein